MIERIFRNECLINADCNMECEWIAISDQGHSIYWQCVWATQCGCCLFSSRVFPILFSHIGKSSFWEWNASRVHSKWLWCFHDVLHKKFWLCRGMYLYSKVIASWKDIFVDSSVWLFSCIHCRILSRANLGIDDKYDNELILECDQEGRVLLLEYSNVFILNIYFPAGIELL